MVRASTFLVALATVSTALGQQACGLDSKCPQSTPCCSQYGQCGVGAYCLGGCDPRSSFSLNSCTPAPVCESKTYTFNNLDGISPNTKYLGDASKADWVSSGNPVQYGSDVLLTMAPSTVGTLLASTSYMWYGNVQAKFKTSRGQGVVTAFILLSDVKDEIDYEFVGSELDVAQSNYYFQGIPDYDNELNITVTDTFQNYHTYEIDWTPDTITWSVDGVVGRTKKRSDTWNASANQWDFPQTPARVQLSLWPAGLASNGPGTVAWAGGLVDWNSADIKNNGYYYASFTSVTVNCFNASSAPGTNTGVSYTYDGYTGTNNTVVNGKNATVIGSFQATGLDMDLGASSGTGSGASPSSTAETIPGMSGGSPAQINSHGDSGSSGSGSSTVTGFVQGATGLGQSGANKLGVGQERVMKGSVFAGIVAVAAMMAL
ncbi:glycoside hydrolase family 16 protein [Stipitochalara longipes BDJ]|nr:glycoside hydrolase family 16 protein [Stipitochalara longipes BDJ]